MKFIFLVKNFNFYSIKNYFMIDFVKLRNFMSYYMTLCQIMRLCDDFEIM
jgi:hypothetical protein